MRAAYITRQAKGAIPNGTRVEKCNAEDGDTHVNGSKGTVIGSLGPENQPEFPDIRYLYFIKWDDFPYPIGTLDKKVKVVT